MVYTDNGYAWQTE